MNTNTELIRVILVDDHPVVRAGLRAITEVDANIVVVGEAGSAAEALLAVKMLLPDVVLLDVRLPDRSGLDVCREIKSRHGTTRVLFLTSFADNDLVLAAMQAGGDGYLLKNNEPPEIVAALRTLMAGGAVFDPVVTRHALSRMSRKDDLRGIDSLSAQERKVLEAVAEGKTDKEVAVLLELHPKTVRNYLDRVFQKLDVNTRTQAAVYYDRFIRNKQ